MSASAGFLELLKDLLAPLGPVSVRRMFGGAGIYIDSFFIAIVDKDVLYFKVDDATRQDFEAEGAGPFTYDTKHGPGTLMSYWRAPERLLDDTEEMCQWAGRALAVARRAQVVKSSQVRRAKGVPAKRSQAAKSTSRKSATPPTPRR
jgi:DNA transformation protein